MALHVELVSPAESLYSSEAELVVARTLDGEIGFQPGHVPFVGVLQPGEVRVYLEAGDTQRIAVHSGFVELANDHLTLLADLAELAADIDVDRATRSLAAAEEALLRDSEDADALAAKRRAEVRLAVAAAAA